MSCKHGNHSEDDCELCQAEEDAFARGVAAGRAAERERCAKLVDVELGTKAWEIHGGQETIDVLRDLAAEIRGA